MGVATAGRLLFRRFTTATPDCGCRLRSTTSFNHPTHRRITSLGYRSSGSPEVGVGGTCRSQAKMRGANRQHRRASTPPLQRRRRGESGDQQNRANHPGGTTPFTPTRPWSKARRRPRLGTRTTGAHRSASARARAGAPGAPGGSLGRAAGAPLERPLPVREPGGQLAVDVGLADGPPALRDGERGELVKDLPPAPLPCPHRRMTAAWSWWMSRTT
jgi:hypothetical protein